MGCSNRTRGFLPRLRQAFIDDNRVGLAGPNRSGGSRDLFTLYSRAGKSDSTSRVRQSVLSHLFMVGGDTLELVVRFCSSRRWILE